MEFINQLICYLINWANLSLLYVYSCLWGTCPFCYSDQTRTKRAQTRPKRQEQLTWTCFSLIPLKWIEQANGLVTIGLLELLMQKLWSETQEICKCIRNWGKKCWIDQPAQPCSLIRGFGTFAWRMTRHHWINWETVMAMVSRHALGNSDGSDQSACICRLFSLLIAHKWQVLWAFLC